MQNHESDICPGCVQAQGDIACHLLIDAKAGRSYLTLKGKQVIIEWSVRLRNAQTITQHINLHHVNPFRGNIGGKCDDQRIGYTRGCAMTLDPGRITQWFWIRKKIRKIKFRNKKHLPIANSRLPTPPLHKISNLILFVDGTAGVFSPFWHHLNMHVLVMTQSGGHITLHYIALL